MLMNGFVFQHSSVFDWLCSETGLSHDYITINALQQPVHKGGHYAGSSDTQGPLF